MCGELYTIGEFERIHTCRDRLCGIRDPRSGIRGPIAKIWHSVGVTCFGVGTYPNTGSRPRIPTSCLHRARRGARSRPSFDRIADNDAHSGPLQVQKVAGTFAGKVPGTFAGKVPGTFSSPSLHLVARKPLQRLKM